MGEEQKSTELGISFPTKEKGYLNLCVQTGNLLITSGHVSDMKGKLGAGLTVEQGYQAARECAVKILESVHQAHGTSCLRYSLSQWGEADPPRRILINPELPRLFWIGA